MRTDSRVLRPGTGVVFRDLILTTETAQSETTPVPLSHSRDAAIPRVNETMLSAFLKPLLLALRGLCFAARWWPVWLVAIALFLANVPGEEHHEDEHLGNGWSTNVYYYHGWPGTYLERRGDSWAQPAPTDTCWQISTGVLSFSGLILLGDALVAAGLLAATAFATTRLRPRFSLRGALLGLAVLSLLMAWAAKWRRDHLAMALIAQTLSAANGATYGSADCPTWLAELLPVPPPAWLTELGEWSLMDPLPTTPADAARIQRALELRPECALLRVDENVLDRPWQRFVGQVAACERLEIDFFIQRSPVDIALFPRVVRNFSNLQHLTIARGDGGLWPACEVLTVIPQSRIKLLTLGGVCVTYDDLARIGQCRDLETLSLAGDSYDCEPLVTSNGLRQLRSIVRLKNLVLQGNTIQIDGSTSFACFTHLRFLTLGNVVNDGWSVTDLESLSELVGLDLSSTPITLADVQAALRLPRLKYLNVCYSGVDSAALQKLQQAPAGSDHVLIDNRPTPLAWRSDTSLRRHR